jgi:hypothetical protein
MDLYLASLAVSRRGFDLALVAVLPLPCRLDAGETRF